MALVIPQWLDQAPNIDFEPEKQILSVIEDWAQSDGWAVSDGSELPSKLRERTDVLLKNHLQNRQMRIAVLPKLKGRPGTVRIDTSNHRIFELVYQPKKERWRVETASVPLTDNLQESGWTWLKTMAFKP